MLPDFVPKGKCHSHTDIVDGHPITYHAGFRYDPVSIDDRLLKDESSERQEKILKWIKENIFPRKTPLLTNSSYGIKHILERQEDIYLTNNAFKDAMLQCGFEPVDYDEINWCFRISKKSPMFEKEHARYKRCFSR